MQGMLWQLRSSQGTFKLQPMLACLCMPLRAGLHTRLPWAFELATLSHAALLNAERGRSEHLFCGQRALSALCVLVALLAIRACWQLTGTHWVVAGMVANSCAAPSVSTYAHCGVAL
jgi:hypothetical protein